ncbi:zinc finger CCHC domain-containing protein 3-like [Latimeria chalumnae]|uniref:zinc finger CCHC domain-containing protein 3-like n=1 Tax=Latimeria chalumnae TaxID=7897 RepID=UPI0003C1A0F1|nr:PREDICTED: zinc finger CCHC domain-containing protein 3-like [Latimeria chalumnae]|eukprot:XP_006009413.1 PREDICTED: zinc finger CCHC domain-containing protein 3-like [Latimeria chalumnae]
MLEGSSESSNRSGENNEVVLVEPVMEPKQPEAMEMGLSPVVGPATAKGTKEGQATEQAQGKNKDTGLKKSLYSEILGGEGKKREYSSTSALDYRRKNVVRLYYVGRILPDCETVGRDLLIDSLKLTPMHVFASIHVHGLREYDVSFRNCAYLDIFWSRYEQVKETPAWQEFEVIKVSQNNIRQVTILFKNEPVPSTDILYWLRRNCSLLSNLTPIYDCNGFWNGGYMVKVQLKTTASSMVHLTNTITTGRDRGYLFYPGQPRACHKCSSTRHLSSNCVKHHCNKCGKLGHIYRECPNIIVCNLCNAEGHSYNDCPKSIHNSLPAGVEIQLTSMRYTLVTSTRWPTSCNLWF